MRIKKTGGPVYRLKVTLRNSKPPIWRRFLVPASITLKRLHDSLQIVMGWTDSHLHQFTAHGVLYGPADPELDLEQENEGRTKLVQVLRLPKDRLLYEYDFGDGWDHDVVLEEVYESAPYEYYPVVLAGRRACPPEDVGGIHGYERFLQVLADPSNPEHADMLEWIGRVFDPEEFDVDEVNQDIHGG